MNGGIAEQGRADAVAFYQLVAVDSGPELPQRVPRPAPAAAPEHRSRSQENTKCAERGEEEQRNRQRPVDSGHAG